MVINHTQRWIGAYYRNTNVLIQFIRTIVYYSNSTGFVDVITICFFKEADRSKIFVEIFNQKFWTLFTKTMPFRN